MKKCKALYKILSVILVLCLLMPFISVIKVKAAGGDTVWIGDKETINLVNTCFDETNSSSLNTNKGGYHFICSNTATISYLNDVISKKSSQDAKQVVIWLGFNDLHQNSVSCLSLYEESIKTIVNDGFEVYLLSIYDNGGLSSSALGGLNGIFSGLGLSNNKIHYIDISSISFSSADGYKRVLEKVNSVIDMNLSLSSETSNDASSTTIANQEAFTTALQAYLGHQPSEEDVYNYSLAISVLTEDGWSQIGIAGLLGNIRHESSITFGIEGYNSLESDQGVCPSGFVLGQTYTYANTSPNWTKYRYKDSNGDIVVNPNRRMGGEGHGIIQWTDSRARDLTNFCKNEGSRFPHVTVWNWHTMWSEQWETDKKYDEFKIPSFAGQLAFISFECSGKYASVKSDANLASDARTAAQIIHDGYEKSNTDEAGMNNRKDSAERALVMIEACTGIYGYGSYTSLQEDINNIGQTLYDSGIWDEDNLSSFARLVEDPTLYNKLLETTRDNMTQEDLYSLEQWETYVEDQTKDTGLIWLIRLLVIWTGIILIVYSLILYISYWIDFLNFFPLDFGFLDFFTGGRFRISPIPEEATYGTKSGGKMQTVNHGNMIKICLTALTLGVFILTGVFYKVIFLIVNTAQNVIHRIF